MSTVNIANVNPGDRHSLLKNFQPVTICDDLWKEIEHGSSTSSTSTNLINHLKRFSESQNVEEQVLTVKQLCKEVLSITQAEQKEWYLTAMTKLYFCSPFKHPVKSALSKSISTLSSVHSSEILSCFQKVIRESLLFSDSNLDVHNLKAVVGNLYAYFSDLQMKPSEDHAVELLQFLNFCLKFCYAELQIKSSTLSADLCDLLISTSVVVVATLRSLKRSGKVEEKNKKVLQVTFTLSESLLNDSDLPYDILCNFGLAIVLILDIKSSQAWLKILHNDNDTLVQLSQDVQRLCICHGLLCGLSLESWLLKNQESSENFLVSIMHELLGIYDRAGNNGVIILGVSRTILKAVAIPDSPALIASDVLDKILSIVWTQLDHCSDTVRHVTQAILEHILSLHKKFEEHGIELSEKVSTAMQSFSSMGRSRYTCMSLMAQHLGSTEVLKQVPNLITDLTESLLDTHVSSHASEALVALMTAHKGSSEETWISTWVPPLLAILSKPSTESHNVEYVLTMAVKLHPDVLKSVILEAVRNWEDITQLSVIIICLKIGRKLGIGDVMSLYNHLTDSEQQNPEVWRQVDLVEILKVALTHEHDTIRSSALSVIVETRRSTEPLYEKELVLIKEFMQYNINYDVPSARQKGLALCQKVLLRIKLNACTLQHKVKEEKSLRLYNNYQNFLNWLQLFCVNNLFIGANFSRRCWSLRILSICKDLSVLDTSSNLQWNNVFREPQNTSVLINVVLADTFEENKRMATDLLMSLPKESIPKDSVETLSLFDKGCSLALSNRPSDTVSAAYVLQLSLRFEDIRVTCPEGNKISLDCFSEGSSTLILIRQLLHVLKKQLKTAQVNICLAAVKGPMYGTLFCIRKVLQGCDFSKFGNLSAWNDLINDLIELAFQVNAAVVGIVNSSSPEGHLPMDFGKDMSGVKDGESKVTAQMILLCSWRTVKEISLLFGELSERCPIRPRNAPIADKGILNETTLHLIGNHFLTLMEETKHRGAFEQAAVGFRLLVARLWRYTGGEASDWPIQWLNEILNMVQSTSTVHKLCATRRSAGIPFMIQALVGTEPLVSRNRPYLNSTMLTLLELASLTTERSEQRTHAFNILRALFRDACLGEFVLPYIEQGFIVAIEGFRCKTWSERNSATLLFSALMTRVFGVRRSRGKLSSRNKMTSYTFFQNYPKLYSFLLEEIELAGGSLDSPTSPDVATLHPVLLVLGRLYPSTLEGLNTSVQLSMFVPWVRLCAACCVYKTRCLAAEAIVPLVANICEDFIVGLFSDIAKKHEENSIHGLLLQCISLLQSVSKTNIHLSDQVAESFAECIKLLDGTHSPMVELSFLQTAELILQQPWKNLSVFSSFSDKIAYSLMSSERAERLGTSLSDALAARVLLELQVLLQTDRTDLVFDLMSHRVQEVTKEAIMFLFYLLLDSCDESSIEEFDDGDEGVDDVLTMSHEGDKPWPLTLPLNKRNQYRSKLDNARISALLAHRILEVETKSDFQEIRYALSALSNLPGEVWSSKKLLGKVLKFLDHPQESVKRAALSCFCSYWKILRKSDKNVASCDPKATKTLCRALLQFSSVENCLANRMACAQFLNEHKAALGRKFSFLEDEDVCVLWTCAMRLVTDDDLSVRRAAVKFSVDRAVLASRAQEQMVEKLVCVFGKRNPMCQATLYLWALGSVLNFVGEDADIEEDRVFDKGEMNTYAEEEVLTDLVLNHVDVEVIKNLSEKDFVWIYSILFDEVPSGDVQLNSALSLYKVVHSKIFNVPERKSVINEVGAASRRLEKILESMVRLLEL